MDKFEKLNSKVVYEGRVIDVRIDRVRYKDREFDWEIVEMGNAVVIIPVISPGKFILINQYRYTAKKFIWEFPAGRAEDGEDLEVCANRELEEECGYSAKYFKKGLSYYPSPGVITEKMHLFYAYGLFERRELEGDYDEIINVSIVRESEIDNMIKNGDIEDAKTILAFYHYKLNKEYYAGL